MADRSNRIEREREDKRREKMEACEVESTQRERSK